MEMTTKASRACEFFTNASGINIERGHFSNVGRDQVNYTIHNAVFQTGKQKVGKFAEDLAQFTEVKRGDVHKHKDVCHTWRCHSNKNVRGPPVAEASVFTAEINIAGPFGQKRFTVKSYRGRDALKEWRRDFIRCSQDWNVPLFGYNESSIPFLIFHGELVPLAHFEDSLSDVAYFYIDLLRTTLRCHPEEVWMDPMKGTFCHGPLGPPCRRHYHDIQAIVIPSAVEFLADDVCIRYLHNMHLSLRLAYAVNLTGHLAKSEGITTSQDRSALPAYTVPVRHQNTQWRNLPYSCVRSKKIMQDGSSRFLLKDDRRRLELRAIEIEPTAWLFQAWSVFHAHDISSDDNLSNFKLIFNEMHYHGTLKKSKHKQRRRQMTGPIYLITHSFAISVPLEPEDPCTALPPSWSFSQTGKPPLSYDMCKYLGLPYKFSCKVGHCYQYSWPTKSYKAIYDHQLANGFDPTTTDCARDLGLPVYNLVPPNENSRFQEVRKGSSKSVPLCRLGTLARQ